jgi:hypothetical protein
MRKEKEGWEEGRTEGRKGALLRAFVPFVFFVSLLYSILL